MFVGTVADRSAPVGHDQLINSAENSDKDTGKIIPLRRALTPFNKYQQSYKLRLLVMSDIINSQPSIYSQLLSFYSNVLTTDKITGLIYPNRRIL